MRAVIVDDELKSRNLLSEILANKFPEIKIVAMAKNAQEGILFISNEKPDVVFLDINMPGKNGFEMLKELTYKSFEIIFITAYDQYAINAFKYQAFDYLLKPIDIDDLTNCMNRLKEKELQLNLKERLDTLLMQVSHPQQLPDRMTIHSLDGITIIPITDIIYLEAAGTYTLFYLKTNEKLVSSLNLKEYEELLLPHLFFRTHHSYIVNASEVRKYLRQDGGAIIMSTDAQVPLSKRKKEAFLKFIEKR